MSTSSSNGAANTWAGLWVTGLASFAQGFACYGFFFYQRKWGKKDLYEPRHRNTTWRHRTPAPTPNTNWIKADWMLQEDELLRCVGLDGYMFLRFLRLGFYLCCVGSLMALLLIPIYVTAKGEDPTTWLQFHRFTLSSVESSKDDSWRLWVPVAAWYVFVATTLRVLHDEWVLYRSNYSVFLAKGNVDMPKEYRYAVRLEQVPTQYCTDTALFDYFDRLFPHKVLQASVFWETPRLDALIEERRQAIEKVEHMVAALHVNPEESRPTVRVDSVTGRAGLLVSLAGGGLVERDAINYYEAEVQKLNQAIDRERGRLLQEIRTWNGRGENEESQGREGEEEDALTSLDNNRVTSTAHVTFTSLRSKQAAIQCELTGHPDNMIVLPAPDPDDVLWPNVGVSLTRQHIFERQAAALFTVGIMFWAIPVAFVTSIAKLNGILEAAGLATVDPETAWYGFVAGLLPVIFLAGFMLALYLCIEVIAQHFVRYKSMTEIAAYTLYWHQLFQFANLWLIVIGGSFFDQLDLLLADPRELINIMAAALPGMAAFFINMMQLNAFGHLGMELTLVPAYGIRYLMSLIQSEEKMTQRELDAARKPPIFEWARQIPPIVFVYAVILAYMPIVPIMELFGVVYFGLYYIVFKHQCLHVYAQDFEGGGVATWQELFPFLMISLYMAELIFIGYMGIKEAPTQSLLGFGPLIATALFHQRLRRTIIIPLRNLPLEIAANVDIEDGELDAESAKNASPLYGMPVLKTGNEEEREPLPYRREPTADGADGRQTDEQETMFFDEEDDGS